MHALTNWCNTGNRAGSHGDSCSPLKIKVDILEMEATEVNISVQLFVIATSVARLEYAYLMWHMCIAVYCYLYAYCITM